MVHNNDCTVPTVEYLRIKNDGLKEDNMPSRSVRRSPISPYHGIYDDSDARGIDMQQSTLYRSSHQYPYAAGVPAYRKIYLRLLYSTSVTSSC